MPLTGLCHECLKVRNPTWSLRFWWSQKVFAEAWCHLSWCALATRFFGNLQNPILRVGQSPNNKLVVNKLLDLQQICWGGIGLLWMLHLCVFTSRKLAFSVEWVEYFHQKQRSPNLKICSANPLQCFCFDAMKLTPESLAVQCHSMGPGWSCLVPKIRPEGLNSTPCFLYRALLYLFFGAGRLNKYDWKLQVAAWNQKMNHSKRWFRSWNSLVFSFYLRNFMDVGGQSQAPWPRN